MAEKFTLNFLRKARWKGLFVSSNRRTLLIYTWGDSLVNWKLDGDAAETKLHFSHVGVRPELLAGLGAGWHGFLNQLEDHLAGSPRPYSYKDLKARYENAAKP